MRESSSIFRKKLTNFLKRRQDNGPKTEKQPEPPSGVTPPILLQTSQVLKEKELKAGTATVKQFLKEVFERDGPSEVLSTIETSDVNDLLKQVDQASLREQIHKSLACETCPQLSFYTVADYLDHVVSEKHIKKAKQRKIKTKVSSYSEEKIRKLKLKRKEKRQEKLKLTSVQKKEKKQEKRLTAKKPKTKKKIKPKKIKEQSTHGTQFTAFGAKDSKISTKGSGANSHISFDSDSD